MTEQEIQESLTSHAFFRGLSESHLATISACAKNANFSGGQFLGREGVLAHALYVIHSGRVAIEIHTPNRGSVRIQTVEPGELVGWSWLMPPHRWQFDARAMEPVQSLALDALCLRGKCEQDHELGYALLMRLVAVISSRLTATRLQLLDIYR